MSCTPAIGIDLGTTYSCVAVWKHDRVEIIPNDQGNRTTPSAVAFLHTDRLIGDAAKNQLPINPTNTIFDAKSLIGRKYSDSQVQEDMKLWPFKVKQGPADTPKIAVTYRGQDKEFVAEEISSMILGKMKETAEAYIGRAVTDAVITVPAYFNDSQRQATKDAGTIAGLDVIGIINEPTAAALAYGLDNNHNSSSAAAGGTRMNVLVFDLGGGTFDVSVITINHQGSSSSGVNFEVKAVSGDTHLGGEDFDNRMVDHCVGEFKRRYNKLLTGNQRALGRLRFACEKAKRVLSSTTETSIDLDCLHDGIDFSMKFTRAKFEALNMSSFKSCIKTVDKCLRDARMVKSGVDEIILVGGSTRIPMVQRMLKEYFTTSSSKELCKSVNPDEAVAHGAAVMAAKLSGNMSSSGSNNYGDDDLVLVDVTPLSLGIKISVESIFFAVIPKNTPIPTKRTEIFVTTVDNQTYVNLEVYQGERTRCEDNHLLGKFRMTGIPPAPRGVSKIKVCFDIDADGILTVTSKILATGSTEKLIITRENSSLLSNDDIMRMLEDANKFKQEDQEFKKKAVAKNALEKCIYVIEKKMKEYYSYHFEESPSSSNRRRLKIIENAIADTTSWLLENQDAPAAHDFDHMRMMLERRCFEAVQRRFDETEERPAVVVERFDETKERPAVVVRNKKKLSSSSSSWFGRLFRFKIN